MLVDHLANECVIKEGNVDPLDSLVLVLLLFLFKHHLDEQLLELLVAIVDAKLLKAVNAKHFKTVDVQNADDTLDGMWCKVDDHRSIDTLHNQSKQTLINSLYERLNCHATFFVTIDKDDSFSRTFFVGSS